jgi:hypothetical protein
MHGYCFIGSGGDEKISLKFRLDDGSDGTPTEGRVVQHWA